MIPGLEEHLLDGSSENLVHISELMWGVQISEGLHTDFLTDTKRLFHCKVWQHQVLEGHNSWLDHTSWPVSKHPLGPKHQNRSRFSSWVHRSTTVSRWFRLVNRWVGAHSIGQSLPWHSLGLRRNYKVENWWYPMISGQSFSTMIIIMTLKILGTAFSRAFYLCR